MTESTKQIIPGIYELKIAKLLPSVRVKVYSNPGTSSLQMVRIGLFNFEMNKLLQNADWRDCN